MQLTRNAADPIQNRTLEVAPDNMVNVDVNEGVINPRDLQFSVSSDIYWIGGDAQGESRTASRSLQVNTESSAIGRRARKPEVARNESLEGDGRRRNAGGGRREGKTSHGLPFRAKAICILHSPIADSPIPRPPTVHYVQIAIRVDLRILQISTHSGQEHLGVVVGPSQYTREERQRVGLHRHQQRAQVVPADLFLHRVPGPATGWHLTRE